MRFDGGTRALLPVLTMGAVLSLCQCSVPSGPGASVERFAVYEADFEASAAGGNPYTDIAAEASVQRPDGATWKIPLFWDGGATWRLRVSPDLVGQWRYAVESSDAGLDGQSGAFTCAASERRGGLVAMPGRPSHFGRQNGDPVWFMGDTAWGYFSDSEGDNHHREQAEHYAETRAGQGFNVIHSMMMSEQGVGNNGGLPFDDIAAQQLNPAYWQEVDERLEFANEQGLTVGLAIAWGDKRGEPFAWRQFPDLEARKRYARYMAARYGAYDAFFLVAGEWSFEIRAREEEMTPAEVYGEFVEIGNALDDAEPHGRMIGIHPWTSYGGVREFFGTDWMSFGDYQQNYADLHERILISQRLPGPVVNSEYGYYLRDQDGDGKPDKSNSYSIEDMRQASWDIVMAGGYLVTGFGTTYFAGHRDPGPFDVDTARNDDWEQQIGHIKSFFEGLDWWELIPADELVTAGVPRGEDRRERVTRDGRTLSQLRPPATTYWAMTAPGEAYVVYVRGMRQPVTLLVDSHAGRFTARQFDPRTGAYEDLGSMELGSSRNPSEYQYTPPDAGDWLLLLERSN